MINIIKYEDEEILPISIIVPHSKKRKYFFENFVFPMLEANMTMEIIINDDEGNAPKKRNEGFLKSTCPYVFFCDDDCILPKTYLKALLNALEKNPDISFAYSGYWGIVLYPHTHPMHGNFQIPAVEFNAQALRRGNYISTMSLMRREVFPGFDENLKRLQDWSLWLTMVERGFKGILVPNLTFYAYYLDSGITSNTNSEIEAVNAIRKKHNL